MKTVITNRFLLLDGRSMIPTASRILALVLLALLIVPAVFSQPQTQENVPSQIEELQAKLVQSQQEAARTERHVWKYLFPAFVIVWLALFGYMRILSRKERELEERVKDIQARLDSKSRK